MVSNLPSYLATTDWSGDQGTCSVVIRMTKDFATNVLPTGAGMFYPTSLGRLYQLDKWDFIAERTLALLNGCVKENALPGWILEKSNIVIAFWPSSSVMNGMYGSHALLLPGGPNSSILSAAMSDEDQ